MPSQVNEEMVLVARDCQSILDICDKLADVSARLLEKDDTRLLESPQLASRLPAKDREAGVLAAARLSDAPIIARIVCKDETNRTRIFYTTPAAPPQGVARANLSSMYSSFGRLTSLSLGESFKTPKGEILAVIDRALLRPSGYLEKRDVLDTLFESQSRDRVRVKSLRTFVDAFGERRRKSSLGLAPSPSAPPAEEVLRPEALDVVVDEGETRPLKEALSLASPWLVSSAQDDIGRRPLSSKPVIIGPPGTGKTAALIRRLDFKMSREALDEEEPGYLDKLDKLSGLFHAASWRLFTPTRELKIYLKDAVDRLAIPDFDRNAAAWTDERLALAKYLGLLDALSAAPDGAGGLSAAAPSDTIGWYQDFTAFHLEAFYRSLASKARKLATDGDSEVAALGADLADIVSKASGKPLSWFRECLGLRQEDLGELVGRELSALKEEVGGLFDSALAQDPGLAKTLVSLETSAEGSSSLSSEGLRASALGIYRRAVCDRARADRLGRTLPKGSLSAKAVSFLGEGRLPSQDRLQAIGAKRSLIAALKRFKVDDKLFLDGYFESLVPNYLRFKRRSRLWYDSAGESPAKVEGLEIDLLILSVLEPGSELARLEAREPGPAPRSRAVARHRYLVRNQILIDDASDFSPVQIKAMASLAHPATGSVSLTADLDLSTTAWGLRSVDQLEWALPRHSLTELSVNYRQSRRLGELADALSGSPRPRLIGSFHEDHGAPKPVFAKGIGKIGDQAKWLSERILEIRDRAGRLPSIGVIAPESAVFKIAGLLARILEPNGVKTAVLGSIPSAGGGGRIWVLTPAQARGLEFEGALLVDPPSGPYLKLAVTRAAAYLGVCLSGEPSPELASLMGSIQEDWAQPEVPLETLDI